MENIFCHSTINIIVFCPLWGVGGSAHGPLDDGLPATGGWRTCEGCTGSGAAADVRVRSATAGSAPLMDMARARSNSSLSSSDAQAAGATHGLDAEGVVVAGAVV